MLKMKMSYKNVIIMAIVIAIYTAMTLILPFTVHTSLANTGTYLEAWIVIAIFIIMNCQSNKDAAIKTFIFFLISQPLIYLFQVPFSYLGWQIFMFYPRWFLYTLATIPGAYIAYYIKKDTIVSSLVLSVATSILVMQGVYFIPSLINSFPKNILSIVFCFFFAYYLIFKILKKNINRIIAISITSLALIGFIFIFL